MKELDLKRQIRDAYTLEIELIDFINQCLKELYPDDFEDAKIFFEQNYANIEDYGCLQGLRSIKTMIAESKERAAKFKKQHEAESKKATKT